MSEIRLPVMLSQQIERLEELYELSQLKKEALLKDDVDCIKELVTREEQLLLAYAAEEDACFTRVQFFLQANPPGASEDNDAIKGQIFYMRKLAVKLQLSNQFNMELIQDSLSFTQFTLNLLTSAPGENVATYSASGKMVDAKTRTRLLDFKG